MNRVLLIGLLLSICAVSCKKDATTADLVAEQAVKDSITIHNYLVKNNLTGVAKKDKNTGEYYIIDTLGTGTPLFSSSTLITVGYKGSVLDSTRVFAQTNNFHPSFALGQVMLGWQIGVPYCKKGGVIRLIIPSQYGYGPYPQAQLGIPENAVLDFTIKLYDISN